MVERAKTTTSGSINGRPPELGREIQLSDNALTVLKRRYLRRDGNGQPAEGVEEMFWRVASHVAAVESDWGGDAQATAEQFYDLLTARRFFPNSPTFTGAGTPLGQLAACFVLEISDDMGREETGIFQTLRDAALIQQTGGGNGFSFSRLRPKGAIVKSSGGQATGPVGFLRVYDQAFGEVAQGGCLTPDTLVFTEDGLLRLDEIIPHARPGWYEHDLVVATDEGPRFSPQSYNNGVVGVLRLTTEEGITVTGTPNHKFKVMTAEGLAWRELQEIAPGDAILVKLGQQRGQPQTLRHPKRQHGNQVMPDWPTALDEALAFFLGYMAGDGFVASGEADYRVGVSVAHDSYLLDDMPVLMQELFGAHVTVHTLQKDGDASVTYVIDNRGVKDFLALNGLSKARSSRVRVPRLVRQSPPEVVGAFLRGLFEADGALAHGYPELLTSSEGLAREVATLLIGLGCPVRMRKLAADRNRYGREPLWAVKITSHMGLAAWKAAIGCDPRSRFAVCADFEPDYAREKAYVLPYPDYWVGPVLEATQLPQIDRRGRGQGKDSRVVVKGHAEFAEHARTIADEWFVTVAAVEEAGEALTLDLEVEDNHTYLANGLTSHNTRRGANMAVLRVDHPDVREFVTCKTDENQITNFNISVAVTDAFMEAVKKDADFEMVSPQNDEVWETVRARDLFDMIVKQAHHNGEPGMLFIDAANRSNPVPHLYELEATNPCGEQFLGSFENCCLGSINLAEHVTEDGRVDWAKLRESVALSTRFLDNVVNANAYVPAVPQLEVAALRVRRIGLGIMGLGDLMYQLGIRYGSEAAQEFAMQVMEFVRYHAMQTSVELSKARGPFTAIEGSIFDPKDLKWTPPEPLFAYSRDWGRPALDWGAISKGIQKHGIRNGAQTTIAPTGTIATVAGCEGYGCEPVFALAYTRHFNDNGHDVRLQYTSPLFEQALIASGLDEKERQAIVEEVMLKGSCQDVAALPEHVRDTFVVSADISPEEHVRTQAALQAFVDNSISKTCNFPAEATPEDVAAAYQTAWELGCKGLTVYVTGSREKVVLETAETAKAKEETAQPIPMFNESKKPRPSSLPGVTHRIGTPAGTAYVTVNRNGSDEPFEVFIQTAKAGSETNAVSEALGRLISYVLRLASPVRPTERLREIVRQLEGIGGGRPLGLGPNRVLSLPDGVARALAAELGEEIEEEEGPSPGQMVLFKIGDLCPECGEAAFVKEEGCSRCHACGFSEC